MKSFRMNVRTDYCTGVLITLMALSTAVPYACAQDTAPIKSIPDLVEAVRPSVVLIRTGGTRTDYRRLPEGTEHEPIAAGTGFVIDDRGHILTNNHVVLPDLSWPDPKIRVTLSDGKVIDAKLVGRDPLADLAVIEIKATGLKPLGFADPTKVRLGEEVIAIGFGMYFELGGMPSVSRGVISALHRTQSELRGDRHISLGDLIQTDAAINHGNSGGPLLNRRGQVVGVNTLTEAKTQGIHFAVGSGLARRVAEMLIEDGRVERSDLGLTAISLTGATAGIDSRSGFAIEQGAFVESVVPNSSAAKAGLRQFDIIELLGEYKIRSEGDLNTALLWLRPGLTVKIVFRRYPAGKFDPAHYSDNQDDAGELKSADVVLGRGR
jgi:S1-C subfamily serine protease